MNKRRLRTKRELRIYTAVSIAVVAFARGNGYAANPPAPAMPPAAAAAATPVADLKQVYTDGLAAFQAGDYKKAIASFESVISQAQPSPQLESIYYTLGAAYFNVQDFAKCVETMKAYQTKFPAGPHLADAVMLMGQAGWAAKDYKVAVDAFKQLETNPQLGGKALFYEGMACKESGQVDQAIAAFEKLIAPGIKDGNTANGALILAGLYSQKGNKEKARALMDLMRQKIALVDNIMTLNGLAVELGDGLLKSGEPKDALVCYRMVRSRDEVIKFQGDRIAAMEKKIAQNIALIRAEPPRVVALTAENNQLKANIADGKKLLEDFQKLPDFGPVLLLRIGSCLYQMGAKWESIVAYDELLQKYPDAKEREEALFGEIVSSAEVNRVKQTHDLCEQYLKAYPAGSNSAAVGYLMGATALQANDVQGAETYFGRMLKEQPKSVFREEMRFLLGTAYFAQGKYDEATKTYETYRTDHPKGQHYEEATYRIALGSLLAGKYEEAMKKLTDYIAKYPSGAFLADARYRLAVCKYSAQVYDEVIAECRAWEKDFGKDPLISEVLALLADALAATSQDEEATAIYIRSQQLATTDEVMNYSLTAAEKLMQKKGDWEKIGAMYEQFVKDRPENPSVVTAVYWIGKAKVHQGKVDEAKQFIAETIKKYIGDPKRDTVEMLLTQLAQLCVRKKPAAPPADATATTGASPVASPEAAPVDPGAELDALLGGAETDSSPIAKARIFFAKSELARLRKQLPLEEKNLQAIADGFKPGDLSPMIIAQVGDYLLEKNQNDKAQDFFHHLMDDFPKSNLQDFAYNGLGEIAYRQKQYDKALKYFTDAVDKAGAEQKLKDVTVGKAKTLLALGKLDEAKKIFEQIASIREWRGEATAFSVYSLGEIAQQQNRLPEAIASYQRVYVAYQRYLPWVAKAYVKSAECFDKLGKTQEAMNTCREMLRNDKLAKFPETDIARKRVEQGAKG